MRVNQLINQLKIISVNMIEQIINERNEVVIFNILNKTTWHAKLKGMELARLDVQDTMHTITYQTW